MKIPVSPPDYTKLVTPELFNKIGELVDFFASQGDEYLHWEKLKYKQTPDNLSSEEYWAITKMIRFSKAKYLPLNSKDSKKFHFVQTDFMLKGLHWLDQYAGGIVQGTEFFDNSANRKKFLVSSIIEEAFRSSQLEGASTTRKKAKEMILKEEEPKNKSERMVLNNYIVMEYINEVKDKDLSLDLIFEIHKIITENTLENPSQEGVFRDNDDIHVVDRTTGSTMHVPPEYKDLEERIEFICRFANEEQEDIFIHPVVKAIILHFMLGYEHPFSDGNGRTARALFYWFCLKKGYWLMEYLSISKVINMAPEKYSRAYLYTETDGYDLTYFIHHQLGVVRKAIDQMLKYIETKSYETGELEKMLKDKKVNHLFNGRQLALLRHMFQSPGYSYTVYEHQNYHNVSYQTANNDLTKLYEMSLMRRFKSDGKSYIFIPYNDLNERLEILRDLYSK